MPTANKYTVGDDVALVVTGPTGPLQFLLTDFTADPVFNDLKSRPVGQPSIHDYLPDGWTGSFKMDRNSPNIDNYFATLEAAYWNRVGLSPGSIYQTVQEADGSVSQWRYTSVAIKLTKAGDYSGPKLVEQSISFMASRKVKVS